jgi:hypothetical protein
MTPDVQPSIEERLHAALNEVAECVTSDNQAVMWPEHDAARPRLTRTRALAIAGIGVVLAVGVAVAVKATFANDSGRRPRASSPTATTALGVAPAAGFLSIPYGGDKHTVTVWGWNGDQTATLHTPGTPDCCTNVRLSPDGTRVLVDGNVISDTQVLDVHGRVLARSRDLGGVWADDSRHVCDIRPHNPHQNPFGGTTEPADLIVSDPGRSTHVIASTLGYGPHSGPVILRCSITDDQAIIGVNSFGGITSVVAIQLSTGTLTTPSWVPKPGAAQVVAISGNGRYALLDASAPARGVIVDTRTGSVVGHVDGQPTHISWNGHLVVQSLVASGDMEVVDWRSHRVVWRSAYRSPGSGGTVTEALVAARPFTDDLALAANPIPGQPARQAALWLITASQTRKVATTLAAGAI